MILTLLHVKHTRVIDGHLLRLSCSKMGAGPPRGTFLSSAVLQWTPQLVPCIQGDIASLTAVGGELRARAQWNVENRSTRRAAARSRRSKMRRTRPRPEAACMASLVNAAPRRGTRNASRNSWKSCRGDALVGSVGPSPWKEGFGCLRAGRAPPRSATDQQLLAILSDHVFRPDLKHFESDHARVKINYFNDIEHATKGPSCQKFALNSPLHGSCTLEPAHGLVLMGFLWSKDAE